MSNTNLFLSEDLFDADDHLKAVEAYLLNQASPENEAASIVAMERTQGLFITEDAMETAKLNEGVSFKITPAYDQNGKPNYLDANGDIVCGIFAGLENEVYHSLPAISSSQVKAYAKSPSHYKRNYIDNVNRKRSLARATEITFDTGTYAHELILEGEGFEDRYFRLLNANEHENCIHSTVDLKEKCKELGLAVSGTRPVLIDRILKCDPRVQIFDDLQKKHIIKNVGIAAVDKAEKVIKRSVEKMTLLDALKHEDVKHLMLKTPIDSVIWDDAHRCYDSVCRNEWASDILQDGFAELSVFAKCPDTGRMLKVRFDWLNKNGVPADLKTTRSADPLKAAYQFADLSYDLQAYMYSYVGRLAGINCPLHVFPFIAVEYDSADICTVFELDESDWAIAEKNYHRHIKNLDESLKNNDWPGYTRRKGSVLLRLPKRGRA